MEGIFKIYMASNSDSLVPRSNMSIFGFCFNSLDLKLCPIEVYKVNLFSSRVSCSTGCYLLLHLKKSLIFLDFHLLFDLFPRSFSSFPP